MVFVREARVIYVAVDGRGCGEKSPWLKDPNVLLSGFMGKLWQIYVPRERERKSLLSAQS